MILVVAAIIVITLLIWYLNPLKLEQYLHAPTLLHSWMDGSGYLLTANGHAYEPMSLTPVALKLRDAGTEFATTLQRRLGIDNAGGTENYHSNSCVGTFDCNYENLTTRNDVATGTMWSGVYGNAALPNFN